jgi:hypothetical protein
MFMYVNLNVYICALVGVLIKCLYEMHGATIKIATEVLLTLKIRCELKYLTRNS